MFDAPGEDGPPVAPGVEWRPFVYEDGRESKYFSVSDHGDAWNHYHQRFIKLHEQRSGHLHILIRGKRHGVGPAVLRAFVGPCPPGEQACHYPDSDPANNYVQNLHWGTPARNSAETIEHAVATNTRGWPVIPGHEHYEISRDGDVFSKVANRVIKRCQTNRGPCVWVQENGKPTQVDLASMLYEAWGDEADYSFLAEAEQLLDEVEIAHA